MPLVGYNVRMVAHGELSEPRTIPVIALLTDFGLEDTYVGVMKGVMLSICPTARLIDLTHAIAPQNVRQAAYTLLSAFAYMPPHTIFVAVVDPGVGSARKPIAIETSHGVFIGPDNGLFSYLLKHIEVRQIVALQNPQFMLSEVSATFHGRDVFSPAAAHIANGVPLDQLGALLHKIEWLELPRFEITPQAIHGEVLAIDRFGNITTSIGRLHWGQDDLLRLIPLFGIPSTTEEVPPIRPESCAVQIGTTRIEPLGLTYSAVPKGDMLALINSAGCLEVAINQGNAAQRLKTATGDPVTLFIA